MKKTRAFLLFLILALSLSTLFACNKPEPEPDESGEIEFEPKGDPYLSTYGDNIVDYDALS